MYAFATCAAEKGQNSDATAYLEYAKIQKGVTPEEEARMNYLMSKYDGREFEISPGSDEEKFLWNKLLREKKENDDFTKEYEKWKSQSK